MTPIHWFAIGAAAIAIVQIVAWPWPWTLLKQKAAAAQMDDPDVLDMMALKRLTIRYEKLNCPEGKAAMQTAGQHFFHGTMGA